MPKLKTLSSAKKRFKITAKGKVLSSQAGKQHNMRKRSNKFNRNQRGTTVLPECEAVRAKSYFPCGAA